jgi:hypothetical protein
LILTPAHDRRGGLEEREFDTAIDAKSIGSDYEVSIFATVIFLAL